VISAHSTLRGVPVVEGLKKVGVVTLFVADPGRSRLFYEQVFGVPAIDVADDGVVFKFENLLLNLLQRSQGPELIEPAPVAPADAGSSLMFTIWVANTDETVAGLRAEQVSLLNGPVDRAWGVRTATFQDPDGYVWEVAQQLGG
jgi:catechol 2,3-dioxygenase-like lactoylglutathione lyase family enzyme